MNNGTDREEILKARPIISLYRPLHLEMEGLKNVNELSLLRPSFQRIHAIEQTSQALNRSVIIRCECLNLLIAITLTNEAQLFSVLFFQYLSKVLKLSHFNSSQLSLLNCIQLASQSALMQYRAPCQIIITTCYSIPDTMGRSSSMVKKRMNVLIGIVLYRFENYDSV